MKRCIVIVCLVLSFGSPALAGGVIVFDPSNFAVNLEQVAHHLELIGRIDAQIRNQLKALENWEFTRLDDLLAGMEIVRGVFDENAAVFASVELDADFEGRFPLAPGRYSNIEAHAMKTLRREWIAQQRAALVQARTVQNRAYLQIAPTQQRIGEYVEQSNAAPGPTAALQAGNEITATLAAQIQTLQALEIANARAELERFAIEQAKAAFHRQRREDVLSDWPQSISNNGASM